MLVGLNGLLVILLLVPSLAHGGIELCRACCFGHRTERFRCLGGIALLVIEHGERGNGLFGIRRQLDCYFFFFFRLLHLAIGVIKPAEHDVIVRTRRVELYDFLVLLNSQLQNVVRGVASLHVAERAQINVPEQFVRFQVLRVALQNFLRLGDGVTDASGPRINFRQCRGQVLRSRIGVNRQAVLLNGFADQVAAPIDRHLFLIHVGHREVIVGGGFINFARG